MKPIILTALCATLTATSAYSETLTADVWADNWFAFYLGETLIKEDSVPITTERSFNKESFSFEAERPFVLNFVVKDFKENDTGLEYIGSRRQQMGDGGLIAQFKDSSRTTIAVTNADWSCLVTHRAPLNKACEKSDNPTEGVGDCASETTAEPDNWKSASFSTQDWPKATEYPESEVSPKFGYDEVDWDNSAKLIWGDDLETNNTLLCKLVVN